MGRISRESALAGYLAAQVWTGLYYASEDAEPMPLDNHVDVDDLPEDVVSEAREDVDGFLSLVESEMTDAELDAYESAVRGSEWTVAEQYGHDFSLTRNGHGAGFWDRGAGEAGETLTRWAKTFGSATLVGYGPEDAIQLASE